MAEAVQAPRVAVMAGLQPADNRCNLIKTEHSVLRDEYVLP